MSEHRIVRVKVTEPNWEKFQQIAHENDVYASHLVGYIIREVAEGRLSVKVETVIKRVGNE